MCQSLLLQGFAPPAGRITTQDVAHSVAYASAPITVMMHPWRVLLNPPPSLGGLLVAFGLQLLAEVPKAIWQDEAQTACMLLACMAVTQRARRDVLDRAVTQSIDRLFAVAPDFLQPMYIDSWRPVMNQVYEHGVGALADTQITCPPHASPPDVMTQGSTTHVSTIDAEGLACSITSSNGEGCGYVVPQAGVLANNFLGEQDINPAGFHVRPAGERMTSMMCPTLVQRGDEAYLALGTGGSNRIRTALLQVLVHHLMGSKPLSEAIRYPRMHYEGGALFVERSVFGRTLQNATLEALQARVETLTFFDAPNMFFGGVHAACYATAGVGDPRRGGSVAVSP